MTITKREEVDRIEIVGDEYAHMQIRTATVIEEDGVEISRSYSRRVIESDHDISGETTELQNIAGVVHTPARKQKWLDKKAADEAAKTKKSK